MKPLFIANWKMHGSLAFLREWAAAAVPPENASAAVCPPLTYLSALRQLLPPAFLLGAQTVAAEAEDGAYTGEVSARMLADCGCSLVIIGHSERRSMHGEDDAQCAAKLRAAAAAGLRPVLCVGEARSARDGAADTVLAQIDAALTAADDAVWRQLIIAYEPLWAIGSGQTAGAEDIYAVHSAIRRYLMQQSARFGGKITLLYGGSVNASNAARLIAIDDVNGFLVGGASLKPREFNIICNSSASL